MTDIEVKVVLTVHGKKLKAVNKKVRLNDDAVLVAAGNLAYGLVEDAWGIVVEKEEAEQ